MKKFFVILGLAFVCITAFAHSVEWYVDGSLYQTTTCDAGDNITPPTAPEKYGYHFVEWSEYTQLEYIESTGTQWIDTGVVPTLNTTTEVKAKKVITNSLFGCSFYMLTGTVAGNFARIGSVARLALPDTIDNSVPHVWKIQNKTVYCDDLSSPTSDGTQEPTSSIYIFGRNENDYNGIYDSGAHTVYYVKIWDSNESLVRNMVPAKRTSDNAIGLYDTVTDTFFENAGTGEFIAGPEVGDL